MATEKITTISPTTNKPVVERSGPTEEEFAAIPKRAQQAFLKYRKTPLSERQKIVNKALQLINDRQDELAQELTEQMGRPIAYTAKEVTTAVARGEYMLKISGDALKDTPGEAQEGFKRHISKVPLGPVLVLFAWNYPYLILVNSLIPALLAGNSVILKPSPQTPTIVEQVHKIFVEAGLDEDVIQYFHCGDFAKIERMVQAPEIQLVCFTGSVAGGLAVQKAAAGRVDCRVGLELGGKDPAYVRSDVNLDWAADEIVDGAVFNSGQSCCSLERVYVHESVHDDFVKAVQKVLAGYKLGDPNDKSTNIGPVISKAAAKRIQSHIDDAVKKGAKNATPENSSFANPSKEGNYIAPTLLTGVNHTMEVMEEETFGPVIPVQSVKSDEEAVKLMNDSNFGLTASIWTKDVAKGEELSQDVEAGTVFVNRADYPSPDLAWVGWKESGKGQTLSAFGFEQFSRLKSYHVKNYPVSLPRYKVLHAFEHRTSIVSATTTSSFQQPDIAIIMGSAPITGSLHARELKDIDGIDYYVVHGMQSTGPEIAFGEYCATDFKSCAGFCNRLSDCGAWTWSLDGCGGGRCSMKRGQQSPAHISDGEQHVAGFRRSLEGRDDVSYTTSTIYATIGTTQATAVTPTTSASALRTPLVTPFPNNTPASPMLEASTGTTVYYGFLVLLVFLMWWAICCIFSLHFRVQRYMEDKAYYERYYHQGRGALPTHPEMQKLHAKLATTAKTFKHAHEMTQVCEEYLIAHARLAKEGHRGMGPTLLRIEGTRCGCSCPYEYQRTLNPHPEPRYIPQSTAADPYAIAPGIFAFFITAATCLLTLAGDDSGSSFDVVLLRRFICIAGPVVAITALPFAIIMRKAVGEVQYTKQTDHPTSTVTTPVGSINSKPVVQQ
ncbi:hypothetical protein LTR10_007606 [Elasticomyces elasticus]|nr:hypothetical protein LTR10_007606 [Elasticomyces elasticus]KAK4970610.1 hypothetical protein LTR42_007585 [Elasticomyces elasticus]